MMKTQAFCLKVASKSVLSHAFAFLALGSHLALAQIPNADFETWNGCVPEDWASNNACGVFATVTQVSTAASGSSAARGEVMSLFGAQLIAPFLQSGDDATGFPISQRYEAVSGKYMFQPVGGDRFGVNVIFYRGEDVVAQGAIAITAAATAYTVFNVPMSYFSSDIPDKAIIQIQIFGPVTGSDYHLGSVMHVDDLSFGTATPTAPGLSMTRNGQSITVTWPAGQTGYVLQSTTQLGTEQWSAVSGVSGNSYTFSSTSSTQRFFRLIKP
ncbi:MAG: hypothetical protein ACO1QB_08000 [Verrucomicrobiales bacterium]